MTTSWLFAPRPVRFAVLFLLLAWVLPAGFRARAQGAGPAFDRAATCGQPTTGSFYAPVRLAVDAAGNAYVAGYFRGAVVFGTTFLTTAPPPSSGNNDDFDWFVARLDPAGAVVWAVQAGGPGMTDQCQDLCLDGQGHVYVTGTAQGRAAFGTLNLNNNPGGGARIVVARLDAATGTWQWLAQGGGDSSNQAYGVAADAAGHVFVAGELAQGGLFPDFGTLTGPGFSNREAGFVARLDAGTGNWQWASFGLPSGGLIPRALALDGAGGVYVCGNYGSVAPVRFQSAGPAGAAALPADRAAFVARLDAGTGAWAWASRGGGFGMGGNDELRTLAADAAGNVVAGGYFGSAAPVFGSTTLTNVSGNDQYGLQRRDGLLVGLDAGTGAWRWAVPVSGPGSEYCQGVALDANGEAYAAGAFAGAATFGTRTLAASGYEAFVARLSAATGAWRWVTTAGGRGEKGATSPVVASNEVYVLGSYLGAVADFGPVALAGSPVDDFGFVGRLANATGPLAGRAAAAGGPGLAVWPSPAGGAGAWVSGPPPGTPVQVLDALGRGVGQGRMPAAGPLALPLPAGRPAGLYLVRAGGRTARLLAE